MANNSAAWRPRDLTNFRDARKLAAMNFVAVRIALIITIIPKMVG
ncbi:MULTISPECIES: hypothetical protein [Achromobacter]|nr:MULTISPECIES: hypothetical protein [Achromobacter]MCW3152757.1 hypothetical protein [Achromobacter spanius]